VASIWRRLSRPPIVGFAYLVSLLRRIPGAGWLQRHAGLVIGALLAVALVALSVSMAQRTPQRVTLPQLTAGELAPMQTWIIVTGDVTSEFSGTPTLRYKLTDPAAPDATLFVTSDHELAVGHTTVSGTLVGGNTKAAEGFGWLGQLRADPVLAREPDPPWLALGLAAIAVFIYAASRSSYPAFFSASPVATSQPASSPLCVGVRRRWPPTDEPGAPATLSAAPGAPVQLRAASAGDAERLQIHSANSSYEVGTLQWLGRSEPVLALHPARGDVILSFDSSAERDSALAGLLADAGRERLRGTPDLAS
jgi:hypothetical protein